MNRTSTFAAFLCAILISGCGTDDDGDKAKIDKPELTDDGGVKTSLKQDNFSRSKYKGVSYFIESRTYTTKQNNWLCLLAANCREQLQTKTTVSIYLPNGTKKEKSFTKTRPFSEDEPLSKNEAASTEEKAEAWARESINSYYDFEVKSGNDANKRSLEGENAINDTDEDEASAIESMDDLDSVTEPIASDIDQMAEGTASAPELEDSIDEETMPVDDEVPPNSAEDAMPPNDEYYYEEAPDGSWSTDPNSLNYCSTPPDC